VVSGWYRPILAIAAALLVLLGAAQATMGHRGPARVSEAHRLASLTESAVLHGRSPSGADLIRAIRREATP
jgi:hypothetical protein